MKKKRAPWPRWAKILRNLLLSALLGFMMWDLWDQPTFSYMVDLRRSARQALFPEPDTVVELDTRIDGTYRIEVTDDMAITSYPRHGDFFTNANVSFHRLREGPDLLCVSTGVELPDEWGQPQLYAAYAVVHPPEGAAGAVLTLSNENVEHVVEGVREGDVFLFYDLPEPDENGRTSIGSALYLMGWSTYKVQFLDADGTAVGQISG